MKQDFIQFYLCMLNPNLVPRNHPRLISRKYCNFHPIEVSVHVWNPLTSKLGTSAPTAYVLFRLTFLFHGTLASQLASQLAS